MTSRRRIETGEYSEQVLETLRRMWAAGDSAAVIGRAIGRTKNSVIGKVHRLQLPARSTPIMPRGSGARPARIRRQLVKPAPAPALLPEPREKAGCQWPLWEGRLRRGDPMPFCEAPRRAPSCSFCAQHAAQAFAKPQLSRLQQDRMVRAHG